MVMEAIRLAMPPGRDRQQRRNILVGITVRQTFHRQRCAVQLQESSHPDSQDKRLRPHGKDTTANHREIILWCAGAHGRRQEYIIISRETVYSWTCGLFASHRSLRVEGAQRRNQEWQHIYDSEETLQKHFPTANALCFYCSTDRIPIFGLKVLDMPPIASPETNSTLQRRDVISKNATIIIVVSIVIVFLAAVAIASIVMRRYGRGKQTSSFQWLWPCCLPDPLSADQLKKNRRRWWTDGAPSFFSQTTTTRIGSRAVEETDGEKRMGKMGEALEEDVVTIDDARELGDDDDGTPRIYPGAIVTRVPPDPMTSVIPRENRWQWNFTIPPCRGK